jgi:hypothetical protein
MGSAGNVAGTEYTADLATQEPATHLIARRLRKFQLLGNGAGVGCEWVDGLRLPR